MSKRKIHVDVVEEAIVPVTKRSNPKSATSRVLAKRTAENMTPAMMAIRDKFVEALLMGASKAEAAVACGSKDKWPHQVGSEMFREPYVQERFKQLREAMAEEQLITRKELILNVKSMAFNEDNEVRDRISASGLLTKVMGFEAPTKTANLHIHQGGVMLVPVTSNASDWEAAARETQATLKENVKQ